MEKIFKKIKRIILGVLISPKKSEPVVGYKGDYETYDEAEKYVKSLGRGYDSDTVFKKVQYSTLAVINGNAVYERDGFLFYEKDINYNLMMYLYQFFIEDKKLNLIDLT